MSWPAPRADDVRVVEYATGWSYAPALEDSHLGWHWTRHLTNALHDAGWWVTRERRRQG